MERVLLGSRAAWAACSEPVRSTKDLSKAGFMLVFVFQ